MQKERDSVLMEQLERGEFLQPSRGDPFLVVDAKPLQKGMNMSCAITIVMMS